MIKNKFIYGDFLWQYFFLLLEFSAVCMYVCLKYADVAFFRLLGDCRTAFLGCHIRMFMLCGGLNLDKGIIGCLCVCVCVMSYFLLLSTLFGLCVYANESLNN